MDPRASWLPWKTTDGTVPQLCLQASPRTFQATLLTPRFRNACFAFASPRPVRRRAFLLACPRDVFAPKNRPNKASSKQRRSRHFPETLSLVETAAGRLDLPSAIFRFCATDVSSRRQVSVGENRHPPARTSPTLLVEHGGSSELRHGVARGRDIERTNAKARRVDQHESHVTVRTSKISARTNRWW